MGHEGALYVPHSGDCLFLVLAECVIELCVVLVLAYSITLCQYYNFMTVVEPWPEMEDRSEYVKL